MPDLILSDNETKVDMLNNRAIAKTVADVIRDCDDRPISIGIHGDWGAGKSSVLVMVEDELTSKADKKNDIVCIRFNGWQHQGFEDAKIALMSAIISELSKNEKITSKAKCTLKKLWKNINWLSVAKAAGSAAFSLATGLPPIGLLNNLMDGLKSKVADGDKVNAALDSIGKYMTDSNIFEDVSLSKEFAEFQSSFESLLKESEIKKLIILIDDLDRCLPKVIIETLEAVRLFMFTKYTAFVIAADEAMIEYAVYNHFPNLRDELKDNYDYSKRYLEKLIQVPFNIPTLGEVESEMYITLLMIGSKIKDDDVEFNALLVTAIDKMKKPWENAGLSGDDLRVSLKAKYDTVYDEISVANQISDILAQNTQGNPRKIKRFLNMLLLRKQIADARGFGEAVLIPILAKLMLAEYYFPNQYKEIATLTDDNGKCPLLDEFEKTLINSELTMKTETDTEAPPVFMAVSRENPAHEAPEPDKHIVEWCKDKGFSKWVASEPALGNIDLRPYFFASKEREDFFFEQIKSEQLRELVSTLMSTKMVIANKNEEIKSLTKDEAQLVLNQLIIKIKKTGNVSTQPNGIEGIRVLVEFHKEFEHTLLGFIESFPVNIVGAWICTGWDKCITTDESKAKLRAYITNLKKSGAGFTKAAAEAALK
ncbi:KAP family NTPase [Tyzzerella sp. OttesenSCG-928-J15]|nr:KAP family NTPase [Tyzzerella sp. OttesenSCG-928-J15]